MPTDTWQPIATAPKDQQVFVYVSPAHGLPGFVSIAAWHPEAGWCSDELRQITHWMPIFTPPPAQVKKDLPRSNAEYWLNEWMKSTTDIRWWIEHGQSERAVREINELWRRWAAAEDGETAK